jgi:hypothetical protein
MRHANLLLALVACAYCCAASTLCGHEGCALGAEPFLVFRGRLRESHAVVVEPFVWALVIVAGNHVSLHGMCGRTLMNHWVERNQQNAYEDCNTWMLLF